MALTRAAVPGTVTALVWGWPRQGTGSSGAISVPCHAREPQPWLLGHGEKGNPCSQLPPARIACMKLQHRTRLRGGTEKSVFSLLSPSSASPRGAAIWGAGTTLLPPRGWIPCSPTSLCGPEPSPAPRRHAAWSEPVPREINYFGASLPLTQAAFLPNFSPLRISALPWDLLLSSLSVSGQDGGVQGKGSCC